MSRLFPSQIFLAAIAALLSGVALADSLGDWTVHLLENPAGSGSAEPHLAVAPDGSVVMSWLEPDGAGVALRFARLVGEEWRDPATVARGDDWFVNWADFPSVVPVTGSLWAAHWLRKKPGSVYAYDVAIALSQDAGTTWSAAFSPHDDGTPTEHGFVSLFNWGGSVGAVWLDGRNTQPGEAGHDPAAASGHSADPAGAMTLRSARIGTDGTVVDAQVVDERVCDCCQTDVALVRGEPLLVYRDRTGSEIRDIHFAVAAAGRWLADAPLAEDGWEIAGCPVNGPAIDAQGDRVAVAWYTMAGDVPRVRLALSRDGGARFDPPLDIDVGAALGRVDAALLDDGRAAVSWLRQAQGGQGEFCVRGVSVEGEPGPVHLIAGTDAGRPSGFPQMVSSGGRLVFAWVDTSAPQTRVRTASAEVTELVR